MNRLLFLAPVVAGALAIGWMALSFRSGHMLALTVTLVIALAYLMGVAELLLFRRDNRRLLSALQAPPQNPVDEQGLETWLKGLPASLSGPLRARVKGELRGLPTPVLTPYLLGLLVMLGLLGTFFGMVETLAGAVTALEGSSELEAIRRGLAAPIAGLGVAFGTSVAGVAGSAMLGLAATLCRRERVRAVQGLDQLAASTMSHLDSTQRQLQAYRALEDQAAALPAVAEKLDRAIVTLTGFQEGVSRDLQRQQEAFLTRSAEHYQALAESVGETLSRSLAESGRVAGESVRPALEGAMEAFGAEARRTQSELAANGTAQAAALSRSLDEGFSGLRSAMEEYSRGQVQRSEAFVQHQAELDEQRSEALLARLQEQSSQVSEQFARLVEDSSELLRKRQAGEDAWLAQHRSELHQLGQALGKLLERREQADELWLSHHRESLQALAEQLGALVEQRQLAEQGWLDQHREGMQSLGQSLSAELAGLRDLEAERATAALEQLESLEARASEHLARLGSSLEEPLGRLIETASETPRAAAELISELRRELSASVERDNTLLSERETVLERLHTLGEALERSINAQSESLQDLVQRSASTMEALGERVAQQSASGSDHLEEGATALAASAVEVASLGEAFQAAVAQFSGANDALIDSLSRIEEAMTQASERSDEQLGYYVAQAREVIDHSLVSQKEIIEELRQLGRQSDLFSESGES